ncbi:DExH-box ATP-dependent RNA helicase DExH14 [Gracilariopsis chorda]|uniref:DExH-box ATP-dependent RNA helicase DExH14 n=1 Tax=Gracilariopsis chorda TaxID=448386 RepID=A0A2V3J132_9FLOR|nr:DExH-box ATP-dependent RNA helicase DExH14 [Gracilariopsis chorda]|eukprot:PXF48116.1 DExH-box ATP-dependent RNA helicase DExH14 [Gracilariopsis chorda]
MVYLADRFTMQNGTLPTYSPSLTPIHSPAASTLHTAIQEILPEANQSIFKTLSTTIYRSVQSDQTALKEEPQALDAIWVVLRSAGAQPASINQLERVHEAVKRIHHHYTTTLSAASRKFAKHQSERLHLWNQSAAADFEQCALSSRAGERHLDSSYSSLRSAASGRNETQSTPVQSAPPAFTPGWLRLRCSQLEIVRASGRSAADVAIDVLPILTDEAITDVGLQNDLFDAFAGDFDAVSEILAQRENIKKHAEAIMNDCDDAAQLASHGIHVDFSGRSDAPSSTNGSFALAGIQVTVRDKEVDALRHRQLREREKALKNGLFPSLTQHTDTNSVTTRELGGSSYLERQKAFPGIELASDSAIGTIDRVGLPKGSTREVGQGYEEIFVPPPPRKTSGSARLVEVSAAFLEDPELLDCMKGVTTLNRLQTAVFPSAFQSKENLLVCAPTGAGKTNVALLTIFREIVAKKRGTQPSFKVVYVAPMKALAAEVTEKFGRRLAPLGLRVREYTGDMSLTKREAMETHVLVTTPEKWDVVTRKSGSHLANTVTLLIVDEVHLLHDDRGAVLESIVARTLRLSETAHIQVRLVGLSATLPNYDDVAAFLKVNPGRGLFHFDSGYRPVPLSQAFIGITAGGASSSKDARRARENKMHEMAWKKVKDSLQRGHQAMIFVHSRKGTVKAAKEMMQRAVDDMCQNIFLGGDTETVSRELTIRKGVSIKGNPQSEQVLPSWAAKKISKSRSADIRELCSKGIGIHNAGLFRPDRQLVEQLFAEGVLRLLCCTATLAWGVNLPARTVVIMGTEVYNDQKGAFEQLGMLDVTQIFGRAGRPQFDTQGEGTIITHHEHLAKYVNMLTHAVPIESNLGSSASRLADHLNAEIVSGTVSTIGEGVLWLSYTYLSVRMPKNPLVYGSDWAEVGVDPGLYSRRATLIEQAANALDDARMCRYNPRGGTLTPTDLGRVSSHFYVSHKTIVAWNELLSNLPRTRAESDADWDVIYSSVIHAVSCATEFEQMRSRQEEEDELEKLKRKHCPLPLKATSETREGKVSILLQAFISRALIRMSDLSYIVQSATRLLRALFEICIRRGFTSFSVAALELARASELRIWPFQHPLWQFTYLNRKDKRYLLQPETIALLDEAGLNDILTLRKMSREELSEFVRAPQIIQTVQKAVAAIPILEIKDQKITLLTRTLTLVELCLIPDFRWIDVLHGSAETWWLWIEDYEENRVYHSQKVTLTKAQVASFSRQEDTDSHKYPKGLRIAVKVAVFDPPSPQYVVRVESDRWHTGSGSTAVLCF